MEKKILWVNGMSCNHCKAAIENGLAAKGVKAVVNLAEKNVTVEYDPSKFDLPQIRTEIEDLGYDVIG